VSTDHKATDNMVEDQVTGEERDIDVEKNAHGHSEADDKDAPATTVPAVSGSAAPSAGGIWKKLTDRTLDEYPSTGPRTFYLVMVILASIVLWYQYYVPTSVAPLLLSHFHLSFHFYVNVIVLSNLAGMIAALVGGITDRIGRVNVVIFGLLIVGLIQFAAIPNTSSKGSLVAELVAIGLFEGIILVATPALVRDFTPQLGRASAMGFWTLGPVAGVLVASLVGSHTLGATSTDWQRAFMISGSAGLVVFVLALLFLRELSPSIRDQLMVSSRDRDLIELRAKGIDLASATRHPWRQMLRIDVVLSAVAISLMLLIFFTASGFFTIYFSTAFHQGSSHFSLPQANGIDTWIWAADCIGLIVFGILSDLARVRKPFMMVGAAGGMVMMVVLIVATGHPRTPYFTLAWITSSLFLFTAMAYTTWMASFTETVEARNPALVATGLAVWGGILRLVVAISIFVLPFVVTSAGDVVNNAAFINQNEAKVLAIENGSYREQVAIVVAHQPLFAKLATYASPSAIPPALLNEAVQAAGGGETGLKNLTIINNIKPQLTYLEKVGPRLLALQATSNESAAEWQHWFWVCFGGIAVFLPLIFMLKGRWSPMKAREDDEAHKRLVEEELARLQAEKATTTA
jgi:MFS family permease